MIYPTDILNFIYNRLTANFTSNIEKEYQTHLHKSIDKNKVRLEKLWHIEMKEHKLAESLATFLPSTGDMLVKRTEEFDCFGSISRNVCH